jgi:hypothetical protein
MPLCLSLVEKCMEEGISARGPGYQHALVSNIEFVQFFHPSRLAKKAVAWKLLIHATEDSSISIALQWRVVIGSAVIGMQCTVGVGVREAIAHTTFQCKEGVGDQDINQEYL